MSCAYRTLEQHISLSQVRRTLKIGAFKVEEGKLVHSRWKWGSRILKEEDPERAITKCIIVDGGLPYPFISPLSLQLFKQKLEMFTVCKVSALVYANDMKIQTFPKLS